MMELRRPATVLIVSVKTQELKRRILVPVPLLLADAVAGCGGWALSLGRMTKARWYDRFTADPALKDLIRAVPELLRELRRSGPMTLVEVVEKDGTRVSVKTI